MKMKNYLCVENGEHFVMQSRNLDSVKEAVRLYGGKVVRECTEEEERAGIVTQNKDKGKSKLG